MPNSEIKSLEHSKVSANYNSCNAEHDCKTEMVIN